MIKIIKSIGLYRTKAKNIILMANQVKDNFNGEIPNTRTDLESLVVLEERLNVV